MANLVWKRERSLEQMNAEAVGTMISHLGIVLTKRNVNSLEAMMPVHDQVKQPMGLLHGGASAALAETLGSYMGYLLTQGDDYTVGLELSLSHMRSVKSGHVRGVCSPLHLGSRHYFFEIKIYDDEGELVCLARHTVLRISPKS